MCPRSPGRGAPGPALRTGTGGQKALEGVDAGAMTVAPLDAEPIGADQGKRNWSDVSRNGGRIQDRQAAHLIHAGGAGAGQAQVTGGIHGMVFGVPFDDDAVVPPLDGVGDGEGHGWEDNGGTAGRYIAQ
jgi:hypothetical protein